MKVWTSPVFYFGILLVVAVAALLAAPFVVDWNSYRADLEAYGKKLTGRAVKIEGPVEVSLFPWPELAAGRVSIANPPGLDAAQFAAADRIVVRMTLAGLLQGNIDVESIDIENPEIALERLPTGEGNWLFSPAADLRQSGLLSRVSLDKITLKGGTVSFADRRRGETLRLDDVNATLASPGLEGPWRVRALALHDDRAYDLSFNSGSWTPGEPLRFGVTLAAADGSGLVFSFDGAQGPEGVTGDMRIEPAVTGDGKTDAEGTLKPLALTAKVKASFDAIALDAIEVAPRDPKDGGVIVSGAAQLTLGAYIDARIDLKASMLDLDDLAGAEARHLLRDAGGLGLAEALLKRLPDKLSLKGSAEITALKMGGETLDNVELAIDAARDSLRIGRFSTGLPGRSEMLFKGIYFPASGGPNWRATWRWNRTI